MHTLNGYQKSILENTSVLLAGGGDKLLTDFIGTLNWDSTNRKLQYKKVGDTNYTDLVTFGSNALGSSIAWDNVTGKPNVLSQGGVINPHYEASKTIILGTGNFLGGLYERGGTCTAYEVAATTTDFTPGTLTKTSTTVAQLNARVFNGLLGYDQTSVYSGTEFAVYDLTVPQFSHSSAIFWSFGAAKWKPEKIRILVSNANNTTYKQIYSSDSCPNFGAVNVTHISDSTTTKIRLVVSKFSRIAEFGVAGGYDGTGLNMTYMSRNQNDLIYRSISPAKNNNYNLGASDYKWANIYATTLQGNLGKNSGILYNSTNNVTTNYRTDIPDNTTNGTTVNGTYKVLIERMNHIKDASGNSTYSATISSLSYTSNNTANSLMYRDGSGNACLNKLWAYESFNVWSSASGINRDMAILGSQSSTIDGTANSRGGYLTLYGVVNGGSNAGSQKTKLQLSVDNEGGNIKIYTPSSYTYYYNNSGGTANRWWEIDAYNGNLRIFTQSQGTSTSAGASGAYGIVLSKDGGFTSVGAASIQGSLTTTGNITSKGSSLSIDPQGMYPSVAFKTTAGTTALSSTSTENYTVFTGEWARLYSIHPYQKHTYATAGDVNSTKTTTNSYNNYFKFRQFSNASSNGARLAYYEDYDLPTTNADLTKSASYSIWTTKSFSSTNVSNWNTAYGWGNHASAGYLKSHQDISGKVSKSGDVMSGQLTLANGQNKGVKFANGTYISTASTDDKGPVLVGGYLRFSNKTDWDYSSWAGLGYDSTNKIISLGIPGDGTVFKKNSTVNIDGTLKLVNIKTLQLDGKTGDTYTVYHTGNKPTASDVGARASSWKPSWSDITGTTPIWNQDTTGNASTATTAGSATTADKLKAYPFSSNNTNKFRLIGTHVVSGGWRNFGIVLAISSRHSGVGIYNIIYGFNASGGTYTDDRNKNGANSAYADVTKYPERWYSFNDCYCEIRYYGTTSNLSLDKIICHIKIDSDRQATFNFFLNSNDGSSPYVSVLSQWNSPFTLLANTSDYLMESVNTTTYGNKKSGTTINYAESAASATNATNASYGALLKNVSSKCTTEASTWNNSKGGTIVWGQKFKFNAGEATYTPSGGSTTNVTDSGEISLFLVPSTTANNATLNMCIDGTYYGNFNGALTGNVTGTASGSYYSYAANTNSGTHRMWYYSGQPTPKTDGTANSAYPGSSNSYNVYSFPVKTNGTIGNDYTGADSSIANIMNLRLQWSTNYLHDIFMSPNNDLLWHRHINNGTAGDWQNIVQSAKGGVGSSSTPVYINGSGKATACSFNLQGMNQWALTANAGYTPTTRTLFNVRKTNAWETSVYSTICFKTQCYIGFRAVDKTHSVAVGLNSDPTTNASYSSIDYCWYLENNGNLCMYENGTKIDSTSGHTTYNAGDEFRIEYSNGYVRYFHNGTQCRSVACAIGNPLYADTSFYNEGSIRDVTFGPMSFKVPNADLADQLAGTNPRIAASSESNEVYIKDYGNGSVGSVLGTNTTTAGLRKAIRFRWYTNYWSMGIIRGAGTDSVGMGWSYNTGADNCTLKMRLDESGNLTAAGNFYATSDIRLKEIINPLYVSYKDIANLPLFDFKWKNGNPGILTGTSAQAVKRILPNLVNGDDLLTLSYSTLGVVAGITACKELTKQEEEIIRLKERVEELENLLKDRL